MIQRRTHRARLLLGALVSGVLALGWGAAHGQEPIKIGGVAPLSAPGSFESGKLMVMGMEIARDRLNAAGGILGRPLQLIVEDTRGLPEQGTAAVEKLVTKDKVVGIVGEFHSSVARAMVEAVDRFKMPFVIAEAWADILTAKQSRYVFRIAPANSLFYTKVADWVKASGFENVVAIAENSDWGIDVDRVFRESLAGKRNVAGRTINYTSITAERTVTDFTPQLLLFKSLRPKPDLLLGIFTGTGELLMLKQAIEIGFAPRRETAIFGVGSDALLPELWETAGDGAVFSITKSGWHPLLGETPAVRAFTAEFRKKYGRDPTFVSMEAYETVFLLAKAVEQAKSTDADAIVAALEKIRFDGLRGTITFSTAREPAWAYHQWMEVPAVVIQYTKPRQSPDEAKVLWPPILKP